MVERKPNLISTLAVLVFCLVFSLFFKGKISNVSYLGPRKTGRQEVLNTPEPALIFFFPRWKCQGAARVDISNAYVAGFLGVDGTLYKGGLAKWQSVVLKTGLTASSERRTSCNFQDSVS